MSIIDTLVCDRAAADIDRLEQLEQKGFAEMTAAERAEWLAGMKGAYGARDLNRVSEVVQYIAGRMAQAGHAVYVSPRLDWALGERPTSQQLSAYLADIATLRAVLTMLPTTPQTPSDMEWLTYRDANDIERILVDLDRILTTAQSVTLHMGQPLLYCGGAIYMLAEEATLPGTDPSVEVDPATGILSVGYPAGYSGPVLSLTSDGQLAADYPAGYTGPVYTMDANGHLIEEESP